MSEGNIKLEYPVIVMVGHGVHMQSYFAARAEVFKDEHGFQWVKFVPRSGFHPGQEHMFRTDAEGFHIVRDNDRKAVQIES